MQNIDFPNRCKFHHKKFISLWKPYAIFLVDSEIWPNLILCAKEKKYHLVCLMPELLINLLKNGS